MSDSIEQVRDRIAVLLGWRQRWGTSHADKYGEWVHEDGKQRRPYEEHPCPLTLDGISALMPRCAVTVWIDNANGHAKARARIQSLEWDTGGWCPTELEARTRLLLAVLEHHAEPKP